MAVKALEVGSCTLSQSGKRRRDRRGEETEEGEVREHELIEGTQSQTTTDAWQQVFVVASIDSPARRRASPK